MVDIYMDYERAERVIRFIETLCVPEGMHQGRQFRLRDWQKDIIFQVYAPVDGNGRRIVRKAIYSVSKKNGKTPLISGLGLTHLYGREAKRNEQLYSAAFERGQAAITYDYMKQMVEMDEELSEALNVKSSTKEIENPKSGSRFKALSSEKKSKHGLGPALLIFDELAQFGADRSFYETLIQGRGAHEEPLLWIISTQADDDQAVLSQEIDYALKVQRGEIEDPTVKLFLFHTPVECDLMDKEAWRLSNPALGDFLSEADMMEAARTAQYMPSAENDFRNLRLNQRVASTAHFLTQTQWKACGEEPREEALEKGDVYAGLDLSSKNDLTALIIDAVYEGEHNIFSFFWTPGDNIRYRQDKDRVPYVTWRDQGHLIAKPGKTIDYKYVARQIAEIHIKYRIKQLRFDRWKIDDLIMELYALGVNCGKAKYVEDKESKVKYLEYPEGVDLVLVPHGQGYQDMNSAVEAVEDSIIEQRVRHGNHPVLTMCVSNAVVQKDPAGNRKFAKDKAVGRIDGVVAMAMAMNGAELPEKDPGPESYTKTHGVVVL
ncbi:MAG: terminase TerL endonuclease subunit [Desulfovibrionales bacterium]